MSPSEMRQISSSNQRQVPERGKFGNLLSYLIRRYVNLQYIKQNSPLIVYTAQQYTKGKISDDATCCEKL